MWRHFDFANASFAADRGAMRSQKLWRTAQQPAGLLHYALHYSLHHAKHNGMHLVEWYPV